MPHADVNGQSPGAHATNLTNPVPVDAAIREFFAGRAD